MIVLKIKKRNRDYGIITWAYTQDYDIMTLFKKSKYIDFKFEGKLYKNRKVSYKYRRFSIGKKRLESVSEFDKLSLVKKGKIVLIKAIN
ncbi:hypothetical protein [Maribacter sp. 2308TA10-17]|uniref:hypothetical protein n=1 Tax=Maribacter sp. 2308TA10-17 TaxID=3386276 RepID=UPI0039BD6557